MLARERNSYDSFTPRFHRKDHRQVMIFRSIIMAITAALLLLFLTYLDFSKPTPIIPKRNVTKNPTLVWYTEYGEKSRLFFVPERLTTINCTTGNKSVQCDVTGASQYNQPAEGYLFYATYIRGLPLPRAPQTIWGLVHEESPRNLVDLMHEQALNLFNFTSTFSRYSDIPMPLFWMRSIEEITDTKYFVRTSEKNTLLSELAPVLYLQSDCDTSTERDEYVKKLMEYIPIDSYGRCLNNKQFPEPYKHLCEENNDHYLSFLHSNEMLSFIARYKFMIAIENAVCKDYVTEKFWRSIYTGVVPIYYGDTLIRDWLPNAKSAILLEDFPTPELMSEHLQELLRNDTKYEEYLEHKTKGLIANRRIFEEMEARPHQTDFTANIDKLQCLMCKRLHDTNDSRVNIANKKHYDCPLPTSALSLSVNPKNPWLKRIREAKASVDNFLMNLGTQRHLHKNKQNVLSLIK